MTSAARAVTSAAPTIAGKRSGEVYPRLTQVVLDFEISNSASFDSVRWPTVQLKQRAVMLTEYIEAAMRKAKYEILSDDNSFYGYIPDFDGVYANAEDLETCRTELKEVLEEWIMLGISRHLPLPIVDGIRLVVEEAV